MNEYYKNYSLENIVYFCEVDNVWKKEVFKDIPGHEGLYQVSDLGRIKSLNFGKSGKEGFLSSRFDKDGYLLLGIYNKEGKQITMRVNQIVAIAFLGHIRCGNELVVDHKNFIRHDNRLVNLRIITGLQNVRNRNRNINSLSRFTGVTRSHRLKKWTSAIFYNKKRIHLGYFDTEEEAAEYYQNAVKAIENNEQIVIKRRKYSSDYEGVYFLKAIKKWISYLIIDKKKVELGSFNSELEAYEARQFHINNLIK